MLHIVGIVGVPRTYGGFETLADFLLDSTALRRLGAVVFCEAHVVDKQGPAFKGARLIPIPWRANGWQSILYDTWGLWMGSRMGGVVLILGTSATFWLPLLRKIFPRARYIVNMAGLEWTRSKWSSPAQSFLRYNEAVAAKYAHAFIADNKGLVDYIAEAYGRNALLIPYGGDQFEGIEADQSVFKTYCLPNCYDFAMARAQPDNNVTMILDAYVANGLPLVFVSNWDSTKFGREVRKYYSNHPNIHMIGPVYDAAEVKALHQRVRIYVHGHSAGGTNPVLVEAMWAGLPTLAFDVPFNRHTTHEKAFYFNSSAHLAEQASELTESALARCKTTLREIAQRHYQWSHIREAYEEVVLSMEVK